MNTKKTISISLELYNHLREQGHKGETFDAIIRRLLNFKPNHPVPDQPIPTQSTPIHSGPDQTNPILNKLRK